MFTAFTCGPVSNKHPLAGSSPPLVLAGSAPKCGPLPEGHSPCWEGNHRCGAGAPLPGPVSPTGTEGLGGTPPASLWLGRSNLTRHLLRLFPWAPASPSLYPAPSITPLRVFFLMTLHVTRGCCFSVSMIIRTRRPHPSEAWKRPPVAGWQAPSTLFRCGPALPTPLRPVSGATAHFHPTARVSVGKNRIKPHRRNWDQSVSKTLALGEQRSAE